jgi:hypothetical protein
VNSGLRRITLSIPWNNRRLTYSNNTKQVVKRIYQNLMTSWGFRCNQKVKIIEVKIIEVKIIKVKIIIGLALWQAKEYR